LGEGKINPGIVVLVLFDLGKYVLQRASECCVTRLLEVTSPYTVVLYISPMKPRPCPGTTGKECLSAMLMIVAER
jgi:hypothetical protein